MGACWAYNLPTMDYSKAMNLQDQLVEARLDGRVPDLILLLQHPSVVTVGVSGSADNIVAPSEVLAEEGVKIFRSDRAGDVTYHGPGQLVGYLILDLEAKGMDVPTYVHDVEKVIIRTLADFSIKAERDVHPGVWVDGRQICALGMYIKRMVTKHGFALNVDNDLRYFSYINPCGLRNVRVTSISKLLGRRVRVEEVAPLILAHSSRVFDLSIELKRVEDLLSL